MTALPSDLAGRILGGSPDAILVCDPLGRVRFWNRVRDGLLDLDFNGYTVVTYWPSQLPKELVAATEVILVTREIES